jgi:hypothetical protein
LAVIERRLKPHALLTPPGGAYERTGTSIRVRRQ